MPKQIKPIGIRMKILEIHGLNAPRVAVIPSDRTHEMTIPATKKLSDPELHQLRLEIDKKYEPHTKVDDIKQE